MNDVQSVSHLASLSDHCGVKVVILLHIGVKYLSRVHSKSSFWKLNSAILKDEHFIPAFKSFWDALSCTVDDFLDVADWWDFLMKPKIKEFCISFSIERRIRRNSTKRFLLSYLKIALEKKDWSEVSRIKSELESMLHSDLMGFIVRSRFKQNAEKERASLFHACMERKNGSNNLNSLKIDENIVKDSRLIEKEVVKFFSSLFNGYHRSDLSVGDKPFKPDNTNLKEFLKDLPSLD